MIAVPLEEAARLAVADPIGKALHRVSAELPGEIAPADPVDPPQPERDRLERARLRVEHLAIRQRTLPRLGNARYRSRSRTFQERSPAPSYECAPAPMPVYADRAQ